MTLNNIYNIDVREGLKMLPDESVARKLNRNFIGFELNCDYVKIAEKRLYDELGMFQ